MNKLLFALFGAFALLIAVFAITAQENNNTDETGTSIISGKGTFVISESPDPKKVLAERSIDILKDSEDEFDEKYMRVMIVHHEGGIALAETILSKTNNTAIEDLANRIISEESDEVEKMNELLGELNLSDNGINTTNATNGTNTTTAMSEDEALNIVHKILHEETNEWLSSLPADKAELAFLKEMKDHHAESVKLAQVAAANAENDELEDMSLDMLARQLGEIGEMVIIEMDLSVEPQKETEPFGSLIARAEENDSEEDESDIETDETEEPEIVANETETNVSENNITNNITNVTNVTEGVEVNTTETNTTDVNMTSNETETNQTNTTQTNATAEE